MPYYRYLGVAGVTISSLGGVLDSEISRYTASLPRVCNIATQSKRVFSVGPCINKVSIGSMIDVKLKACRK